MKQILSIGLLALAGLFLPAFATTAQAAAVPCTDGVATVGSGDTAVSYDCLRVDFLSHMTIAELGGDTVDNNRVSDMWGWTDSTTGNHYAIVGLYCSTAFVDVTDPENPVLVGTLPDATELDGTRSCTEATNSTKSMRNKQAKHDETGKLEGAVWRDIKVENNIAYIVSDHFNNDPEDSTPFGGPGLQVFDLTHLRTVDSDPATPAVKFGNDPAYYRQIGNFNAHNIFTYSTDTQSFAVVVGATHGSVDDISNTGVCAGDKAGGPLFYSIDNLLPVFKDKFCADGYTHDIECVVYENTSPDAEHHGKEICFASNEDTLTIFDATNKANFKDADLLSKTDYSFVAYTHQGSLDAAQTYFYMGDEMDEANFGLPTRTLVLDVSDLDAPELTTEYLAPVNAIDHNQYVHGDYLYQSNYTSGLRILDIHTRESPYQKAFFDTYPASNATGFAGTWSNYRFPNGTVGVSDITGGLFMLRPTFDDSAIAELSVAVDASVTEIEVETPYTYTVSVTNNGPVTAEDVFITLRLSSGGLYVYDSTDNDCEAITPKLMRCRAGSLSVGETAEYTVEAAGVSDYTVLAIAMVSAKQQDAQGANNVVNTKVTLTLPPTRDGGGAINLWMLAGLLGVAWLLRRKQRA